MSTIENLRNEIDQVHIELHALLLRRRELTMDIWKIKKEQGIAFHSSAREEQILRDFVKLGSNADIPPSRDHEFEALLGAVMKSILNEYEKYLKTQFS